MIKDEKLWKELHEAVSSFPLYDTHEHILDEQDRRESNLDFSLLFMQYAGTDLMTSGLTEDEFIHFQDPNTDLEQKWRLFAPHWPNVKNTSYCQLILEATKDLYDTEDINQNTYIELSEKIRNTRNVNWYDQVIKEKSNIEMILNHLENIPQVVTTVLDRDDVRPVINLDEIISTCCREDILDWEKKFDVTIYNLQDLLEVVDAIFEKKDINGYKAVKTTIAYMRTLQFEETTFEEANKIFARLFKLNSFGFLDKKDFLSKTELKPFQDYMVHYIIRKAVDYNLPVQIHTGIFELLYNDVSHSNPSYLVNLFYKYRKCSFDIFHAGYPYSDQLIAICKQFPNVYFNMCWIVDISPSLYKDILNRLIEIIPSNKIFGFGGDYMFVEGLYGSQKLVRKSVAELLYKKIEENYFTFEESLDFAEKILYLNPKKVYHL